MLRNPIDRAFSHFNMEKRRGLETHETFEEAIDYPTFNVCNNSYLSRGMYADQIDFWLKCFNLHQFLFIKSENFFNNPQRELTRVYQFLNIKPMFPLNIQPQNFGNYKSLHVETRKCLAKYYQESNNKVRNILGKEFNWKNMS